MNTSKEINGKRIILMTSVPKEDVELMIRTLEGRGHEVVYCVVDINTTWDFPNTIFHFNRDARMGKPPKGMQVSEFPPLGADMFQKLYETESLVLTMMNRKIDTPDDPMVLDEKKRFYYDLVRYWHGVIDTYKPDSIVFSAAPHSPFNFVLYSLAKLYNIATIIFHETWISDRLLIQEDYIKGSTLLHERLAKNKGKRFTIDDLDADIAEFYRSHRERQQDPTPKDVTILKKQSTPVNIFIRRINAVWESVTDLTFYKKVYYFIRRLFGDNIKREYNSVVFEVDLSKKFVYVPLHWQPECTTSPLGGIFVDQILMIEILSSALPPDWVIYVKEHPFQWSVMSVTHFSNMRYRGYYKKIAQIPHVRIIPIGYNTYNLIDASQCVATITGRVAIEGVLRNTPGIIFGHPWFKDLPGLFAVDTVASCKEALNLIKNGYVQSHQEVIIFFKSLGESTTKGFLNHWGKEYSVLTEEENRKNLISLLITEIEK